MLYTKAITLSLILSCSTAMGFEVNKEDNNNYHPPAVTTKILNSQEAPPNSSAVKNISVVQESPPTKITELTNLKMSIDPLDEFITSVTKINTKENYVPESEIINQVAENTKNMILADYQDKQYQVLKTNEMLLKEEWYSTKESLSDYNKKVKKLRKMQKLATYIAEKYNVPLSNAEKIVYFTFVESNKKDLDPALVLSVIDVESTFQQFTKSRSGAVGLTQIMPKVHKEKIGALRKENMDLWSITGNIKVGTQILKEYVDLAGGNLRKALQMYNGSAHDIKYKYSNKIYTKMSVFNTVLAAAM